MKVGGLSISINNNMVGDEVWNGSIVLWGSCCRNASSQIGIERIVRNIGQDPLHLEKKWPSPFPLVKFEHVAK
jgi:hypothetical protein